MQKLPPTINPFEDELIPLSAAARLIRTSGKTLSPTTLWRWVTKGKQGVHLPATPVGHSLYTTEEAMRWFFAELQRLQCQARVGEAVSRAPEEDLALIEKRCRASGI